MNINSGKEWSAMDIEDLENDVRLGVPIELIANFLCRDIEEVKTKPDSSA
jgi:hypothetical protein